MKHIKEHQDLLRQFENDRLLINKYTNQREVAKVMGDTVTADHLDEKISFLAQSQVYRISNLK
ncbi:hypothetical protein HOC13_01405 [Candidatus Woesearchaeota archaeon]|nr:hypothetical protein [Candidatus Woesearchaeota archaeon]